MKETHKNTYQRNICTQQIENFQLETRDGITSTTHTLTR